MVVITGTQNKSQTLNKWNHTKVWSWQNWNQTRNELTERQQEKSQTIGSQTHF